MSQKSTNSQEKDILLLEKVLGGSSKAFHEFYGRYNRLVISCIRKIYFKHSIEFKEDDISDIVGQVFLNLVNNDFHKLRLYDENRGYKLSSWIGLISTNTTYDILRRKKLKTKSLNDDEHYYPEPVSDLPSPLEKLQEKEQITVLLEAIELLSQNEKRFVELFYEHQLSHEEISVQLGISLNTVYSKKNKIKSKLMILVNKILENKK